MCSLLSVSTSVTIIYFIVDRSLSKHFITFFFLTKCLNLKFEYFYIFYRVYTELLFFVYENQHNPADFKMV